MKSTTLVLIFLTSLSFCFGQSSQLQRLDDILKTMSAYQYGEPENWRSEFMNVMQGILGNSSDWELAAERLEQFVADHPDSAAAIEVYRYIETENLSLVEETPEFSQVLELLEHDERSTLESEQLLSLAEQLFLTGRKEEAFSIYHHLYLTETDDWLQAAAMRGLVTISQDPIEWIELALNDPSEVLRSQAIRLVKDLPDDFNQGLRLLKHSNLNQREKIQLLTFLAARHDPSIHDWVIEQLMGTAPKLQLAALRALQWIGEPKDLTKLVEFALSEETVTGETASQVLAQLPGKDVDKAIVALIQLGDSSTRRVLIQAVEDRHAIAATPVLIELAAAQGPVQKQAIKSLASVTPLSQLEDVIELWIQSNESNARKDLERTLSRITIRFSHLPETTGIIEKYLDSAETEAQASFLKSLIDKLRD